MLSRLGDYEILRKLGEGGMATALLGRSSGGRLVVLKVPLEASAEMAIKLRDEAQAGFRIRHPNVVETIDYFLDAGRPVLVVDYIDGCPLRDLRRLGGQPNPLPPAAVAWLGRSIAEGLAAIHDATDEHGQPLRMLHRDVTPSNILIGRDGVPRLIDLGIARSTENQQERTEVGMLKGTLRYVAPELLAGQPYSVASDLWSLGVCLFEAALGRHMVSGEAVQIFRQLTMGTYRELRPGESLHPDLAVAIFALVTDVTMRLRNARAAAAVFARLEQKLVAEDPNRYPGQSWLQSWVPWAVANEDDKDSGWHAAAPAPEPSSWSPSSPAPSSSVLLASPTSPLGAPPPEPSVVPVSSSSPPPTAAASTAVPPPKTVLGDERFGMTPTLAMPAARVPPPPPTPEPASTLVLPRVDVAPPTPEPASTLVLPRVDVAPTTPEPASTLVLPRVDVAPTTPEPASTLVLPRVDVAPTTPEPASTLVLPQVDLPALPPVRTEVPAHSGIGIGPGLGIGPTMVLPKVDLRPSNPGTPLSSLAGLRGPRLVDAEAAPGDVLPEGAATIQMEAWSPPVEAPAPASGPPPSSAAPPTRVMPVAAVPAAPSSVEAAATVMMGAVDIEPGQR
jgi:eukaryotic-like serine/threonine-protein kinase